MDNNILSGMNERYINLSQEHKRIVDYIATHYEQAMLITPAQLGEIIGVSETIVVHFASGISYGGYPKFLTDWAKSKLNTMQKTSINYGKSGRSDLLASVLALDMERLQDTMEHLDRKSFEMAVDVLLAAETVYVVGLRSCGLLAEFLHFYLNMVRRNIILVRTTSASELFEQMIHINEKDVLVGISFPRYSMRTLKAMEFANDRNAKVIAITDSVHSPMNLYSSCNLCVRTHKVSIINSLVAPLSLINALVVAICQKQPLEVKTSMERLEEVWESYQVYLNDEIDIMDEEPSALASDTRKI
ncbi:MAG: MurR/RpiR family transcriptional regulator [Lachnospiraceae bacterium]|nr:MurR/RpiR family transcriptional regulator [Lachnospiraceae bacterium]